MAEGFGKCSKNASAFRPVPVFAQQRRKGLEAAGDCCVSNSKGGRAPFVLLAPFWAKHKKGVSLIYRTATTTYPCCGQALGEFSGSWSYTTYPGTKVERFFEI